MRVIDKNGADRLTDVQWFWITVGKLQAKAWLADREHEEIQMEVSADAIKELLKPSMLEDGKIAYLVGIKTAIDDTLNAASIHFPEQGRLALMYKAADVSLVTVNVSQEKRQVEKTTVVDHTEDGRIRTFIKEQIQI
jgi:hypothetical protein